MMMMIRGRGRDRSEGGRVKGRGMENGREWKSTNV